MGDQAHGTKGTRERLLEAAGEVFAERGFREATIREIVKLAEANLNAVNYHFRDKEGLYRAVFEYAHQRLHEEGPAHPENIEDLSAEERLRAFVRMHLHRMLTDGRPAWFGKLRAREMVEPTGMLDELIERHIRPHHELLLGIVRELIGSDVPERRVGLCAISIVGQCLHYHHGRPVITRLRPELRYDPEGLDEIADHITRFSMAALRNLPQQEGVEE